MPAQSARNETQDRLGSFVVAYKLGVKTQEIARKVGCTRSAVWALAEGLSDDCRLEKCLEPKCKLRAFRPWRRCRFHVERWAGFALSTPDIERKNGNNRSSVPHDPRARYIMSRFDSVIDRYGLSYVGRALSSDRQTVWNWRHRKNYPGTRMIERIVRMIRGVSP